MILGVDEADGQFKVVGVNDQADLEAGLAAQAREAVAPSPHLEFQTLTIDGKTVLIAHVSPLRIAHKPAFVGDRAYLRQADRDYPMQPHELRMIEVAKLHTDERVNYDLAPAMGRSTDDLSPTLVNSYTAAVRAHDQRLRGHDDIQIRMTNPVIDGRADSGRALRLGGVSPGAVPSPHCHSGCPTARR